MKYLLTCVLCLLVAGCGEEFAAGFGTGAATMGVMAEDAQAKFIAAVNELNAETERINTATDDISGSILVKPETLEAIKDLKGRGKDPVTWMALFSMLGNAVWAGRTIQKRIVK